MKLNHEEQKIIFKHLEEENCVVCRNNMFLACNLLTPAELACIECKGIAMDILTNNPDLIFIEIYTDRQDGVMVIYYSDYTCITAIAKHRSNVYKVFHVETRDRYNIFNKIRRILWK